MIAIGMTIYGFCDGYFSRDFYEKDGAKIEAFGYDWIVVRKSNGFPAFTTFDSLDEMVSLVTKWSREASEEK